MYKYSPLGVEINQLHSLSDNKPVMREISRKEFLELLDHVDANNDCLLDQKELKKALRQLGLHFTAFRAWRARRLSDHDENHYIDGTVERKALIDVLKRWGVVVRDS